MSNLVAQMVQARPKTVGNTNEFETLWKIAIVHYYMLFKILPFVGKDKKEYFFVKPAFLYTKYGRERVFSNDIPAWLIISHLIFLVG